MLNTNEYTDIKLTVERIVNRTPVLDIHTHLYPTAFGPLSLWGIDEVVTYHYLIAEVFRFAPHITKDAYWAMSRQQQADLIWDTLFVRNTPISEAARGVVCVMTALGLDPRARDLNSARAYFSSRNAETHIDNVMRLANVSRMVMTNDPFNATEARVWQSSFAEDPRFAAALRMDPLVNGWPQAQHLKDVSAARKFLDEWVQRMKPLYMAVSLPNDFSYPDTSDRTRVIREIVVPTARQHGLPFAMMIGVRRQMNPSLGDAGDGVGRADVAAVANICAEFPDVRFLVTMLSRENQHELCVTARKFSNLMIFGCWWFLNNPSIIEEITSERVEMLGASFIPQHSDSRILEQLIYKWTHSRRIIADVLSKSYAALTLDGRRVTEREIERDVQRLFSSNFEEFVNANKL